MTFDPFEDFKSRGYLRNLDGLHDEAAVKEAEHRTFLDGLDDALAYLAERPSLTYADVLAVHRTLFEEFYPWAGQDRAQTAPDKAIEKGPVLFAHPADAQRAVEYGLRIGQNAAYMAEHPGEVMGYLAYGHPFLDGNGRTLMVVHNELAHRAGISINWGRTGKFEYLTALTHEIDAPDKGHLDAYLRPFIDNQISRERFAEHIAATPGLGGTSSTDIVLGRVDDPAVQARYAAQRRERGEDRIEFYRDRHPDNSHDRDR